MSGISSGNFIDDALSKRGALVEVQSPVTGDAIDSVPVLDCEEIESAIANMGKHSATLNRDDVLGFLARLKKQILRYKQELLDLNHLETGFIEQDNVEIIEALIEYLDDFEVASHDGAFGHASVIKHSYKQDLGRYMRLVKRPYRCVAVLVPQNASLALAVISIASALYVGAKVIIRPSLQCGVTGAYLAKLVDLAMPPKGSVLIANSKASAFLNACYRSELVDVVHYIGSDQYAKSVLCDSFEHGKLAIVDGEGNGFLYVDETFPLERAVKIIVEGAARYNGETCTSVNGVLIDPSIYEALEKALIAEFRNLTLGHPRQAQVKVGPLFSSSQAEAMLQRIHDAPHVSILCGGKTERAYFSPTIITNVRQDDALVKEGFFGPAVWLKAVDKDELWQWLALNRFPLSDTILSNNRALIESFVAHSKAARICINEDPSIESMFEPWGGYPPGGLNPVSVWMDKYRQSIQLDGSLDDIQSCY